MSILQYQNRIYAGVLGKMIGVYLGRPVEGWTYEQIRDTFGQIYYYKNHKTGAPLIVPDDDISGTFAFFRALEDSGYQKEIKAEEIGNAWLNYIVENETILWWGGLCRSTEHTAYLRLKQGIKAPESGSMKLNGRSMAEQIGSEIFIDTWALVNPGNPKRAAQMAKEAASVSHDGVAVDAAVYLAAMEAMAFEEKDLTVLMDRGLAYVENDAFQALIGELRDRCAKAHDWREVRNWIAKEHGYERYPGNCPIITNHLTLLMALLMGGDDFQKSCMIACSAGWDTDCNAGNVGCLNGIRLGLSGLSAGAELRKPVADRMYIVTSDSGSCVTDAVQETRKIVRAAAALNDEMVELPKVRYGFEYPGSTQGWIPFDHNTEEQVLTGIANASDTHETTGTGLVLSYQGLGLGVHASAAVDTFVDLKPKGKEGTSYFDVLCSPTLYSGQIVAASVEAPALCPDFTFFLTYFNEEDELATLYGEKQSLQAGVQTIHWRIPDTKGHPIYQLGICLTSEKRMDGSIVIRTLDWSHVPLRYAMGRSMEMTPSLTPWTTTTSWLQSFVSSADHFNPDYTVTFSICHAQKNGLATTGTSDWADYSVQTRMTLSQQDLAGLVARAKGHRRYYGAVFTEGYALIYRQQNEQRTEIAKVTYDYRIDETYQLEFVVTGNVLRFLVNGSEVVSGEDDTYSCGQAGFVVDSGAVLADGFLVTAR